MPSALELIKERVRAIIERLPPTLSQRYAEQIRLVLSSSNYALNNNELLQDLLTNGDEEKDLCLIDYQELSKSLKITNNQALFAQNLRIFRKQQMLRIIFRDIAKITNTEQILRELSDLAQVLIGLCIEYSCKACEKEYGQALSNDGQKVTLNTLAMGKLGGRELNFSSDIDLIFVYSEDGFTNGDQSIPNQQFFTKAIQMFVKLMTQTMPEGIVYRVDLRLRPNGDSGPLVMSMSATENYYQEQGRDWERYAMVKARNITGNEQPVMAIINPFVYRRYVDFSVIESLRSMKAMIEREVKLKKLNDDIKRGRGGIRELEFIIQSFQLIRGGRVVGLQQQNFILAVDALSENQLLDDDSCQQIKQAYLFLRTLENRLQMLDDRQVHVLPKDETAQAQVALGMGYASWAELLVVLESYREVVISSFNHVLNYGDDYTDEDRLLNKQLSALWQGHFEATMAENLLESCGYLNPKECYQMIHDFRHSARVRRLSQVARLRLDTFMVLLLHALPKHLADEKILTRVLQLLDAIVGRSAYLALLSENKNALTHLLTLFSLSPWVAAQVSSHPFLLEVLLDDVSLFQTLDKQALRESLCCTLSECQDNEQQLESLRQFKLKHTLSIAAAELTGKIEVMQVGVRLSLLSEIILKQVVELACNELSPKFQDIGRIKSQFAIIAYGKLGSLELNYDSDLDLVFLHSVVGQDEPLMLRMTQKILHLLGTRSSSGVLYKVDTRLRPSGSAGLLVSHIDAFSDYQLNQAWTWEHQALVRARVLSDNNELAEKFNRVRYQVLSQARDKQVTLKEVTDMRKKMFTHLANDSIKARKGGLIDLEFLLQYFVLAYANTAPQIAEVTQSSAIISKLYQANLLTDKQAQELTKILVIFHETIHKQTLLASQSRSAVDDDYFNWINRFYTKLGNN